MIKNCHLEDESMTIGARIKERRKELKLTQKALALQVGISRSAVNSWEMGDHMPGGPTFIKLLDALACSHEWLETGKGDPDQVMTTESTTAKSYTPLVNKLNLSDYLNGKKVSVGEANIEIANALNAGPKTFAYIETSEGMMHRITPKDTVYIDPEGKLEPNSIGIFLFKAGMDYQLGTLKSTPGGLMLQFDSNEPGWNSIAVSEDEYIGRLVAYVPHWLLEQSQ